MKKISAFLLFINSIALWAAKETKTTNDIPRKFQEAYKFEIEKKTISVLKSETGPYEYLYLSINGKIIKGAQDNKEPAMNIFELIERDSKDAQFNDFEKNKLAEEIVKMQLKNLKSSKEKEEFEKDLILRGRINGYFDSEKRAYISQGLKIFPKARIIEPYQG